MATRTEGQTFGSREPPPPAWDGSEPGLELPVFERNVRLWEYESDLGVKQRDARLLRNLSGSARVVADNLEFEKIACEDGVKKILQELRAHFAPHVEVSLPRAFERAVYGKPRSHKETMQDYLIRCERSFHLLAKEACKLPEVATWSIGKHLWPKLRRFSSLRGVVESLTSRLTRHVLGSWKNWFQSTSWRALYTALVQECGAEAHGEEEYEVFLEGVSDNEQHVYLEELDEGQIYDESDIQVALVTYQEIRKAINSEAKGRQFYGGEGRGSGHQKGYFKGKRKIKIEELGRGVAVVA